MVHEGDTYFERCYGADFVARVQTNEKEACWQAWLAHYTKHQPAHRVDYAMGRIEALQAGEPLPQLPGLVDGELAPPDLTSVDAAAPTPSALVLSPLMDGDGGVVPNGCARYCGDYEQHCNARCAPASVACRKTCTREHHVCIRGCY